MDSSSVRYLPVSMEYRPYPLSTRPWIMHQRWHDLLFAHWPVSPAVLRPLIPAPLEIDTFERQGWVGVVPFWMSNVRPRFIPPVPGLSCFPELNVRTYVSHRGKPGVFFFSLDAANRLAVRLARALYQLPYFDAEMSISGGTWESGSPATRLIRYNSRRTHSGAPPADLRLTYGPTSGSVESTAPPPGSLPYWLTARYCLYSSNPRGDLFCGEIHHEPWPLQEAEAEIELNTMGEAAGIDVPDVPPILHFSRRLDVQIWALQRCETGVGSQ